MRRLRTSVAAGPVQGEYGVSGTGTGTGSQLLVLTALAGMSVIMPAFEVKARLAVRRVRR